MLRRQKNVLAAQRRSRWSWPVYAADPKTDSLGRFRKRSPYIDRGCRCGWCRPERVRRRANEKRDAILDSLSY